jgi:[lysine-biosynthesis-protein LysW]--L-2-aminoadipate ligase
VITDGAVAVVASRVRSEERRIFDALERRGVEYVHLDSRTMWTFCDATQTRWPTVLNREIGYGRAVTVARTLEAFGALVINSAAATETCGDKWRTTLALCKAGLPVPRTALACTPDAALTALDAIGYPAVIKPLNGSWGRLVTLVRDRQMAETVLEYVAALPAPQSRLVYVQEMVGTGGRDIRAVVINGEVLGTIYRRSESWRTSVARGAVAEYCPLTPELSKLSLSAAAAVKADVAGVDLIENGEGRILILEVNHGVEFAGFQHAMGERVDVANAIVDCLLERASQGVDP